MKINGVTHYLWRVVDHEGEGLESIVTKTRDRKSALRFLKKSMKRHGRPETIVTDRLRSDSAALKDLGRGDDREMWRWLNNRAENSHLPFQRRERALLRFRRMRTLQKFALVHASVHNHFPTERHLENRDAYKQTRAAALAEWCGPLAAGSKAVVGVSETGSHSSDRNRKTALKPFRSKGHPVDTVLSDFRTIKYLLGCHFARKFQLWPMLISARRRLSTFARTG